MFEVTLDFHNGVVPDIRSIENYLELSTFLEPILGAVDDKTTITIKRITD